MPRVTRSGWRWLAWRAGVIALCALLVISAWLAWNWKATRRLDRMVAEMRSHGEPVRWSEIPVLTIPDEENGATYFKRAAAQMTGGGIPAGSTTWPRVGTAKWRETAEKLVAQNAAVFDLVRKGSQCRHSVWIPTAAAGGLPAVPNYNNMANLARLVRDKALMSHVAGHEVEAIEIQQQVTAIARSVGERPHLLISGLVAYIVESIAQDTLGEIALDIRIGAGGIPEKDVESLIERCLHDDWMLDSLAAAYAEGRTGYADAYLSGNMPVAHLAKPMMLSYLGDQMQQAHEAARRVRQCLPSVQREPTWTEKVIGVYSQFDGVSNESIRYILNRRATAVILAIQLYRHAYGTYPAAMADLVPECLPEIPADPRSTTGRKLEYMLLEDGRRPVIVAPGEWAGRSRPDSNMHRLQSGAADFPASVLYIDASRWDLANVNDREPDKTDRKRDKQQPGEETQAQ